MQPLAQAIGFLLVLLLLAATAYLAQSSPGPEPIYLKGGERQEQGISSDALDDLGIALGMTPMPPRMYFVAQYERPLPRGERDSLESQLGIRYLDALPANSYIVSVPTINGQTILDELLIRDPPARAIVSISDQDKVSPALYQLDPNGVPIENPPPYVLRPGLGGVINQELLIRFFADVPLDRQRDVLRAYTDSAGDDHVVATQPVNGIWTVEAPESQLFNIAKEYEVQSVEPTTPPIVNDMNQARGRVAVDAGVTETGSGVVIAQWEICMPDISHGDLGDIWQIDTDSVECTNGTNPNTNNSHATLVAGVITGDGIVLTDYPGIAPDSRIVAFNAYNGAEVIDEYITAIGLGATISNNSWGLSYAEDLFSLVENSLLWYPVLASHYDATTSARTAGGDLIGLGKRTTIVASTGNEGHSAPWFATRIANSAKNVITVGGVSSGQDTATNDPMTQSGRGPTGDGRLSPLLVAPSIEREIAEVDWGIRSTARGGGSAQSWGTSFSTPIVSGLAALVTEKYRNMCGGTNPVPAEIRALLVHTATDLTNAEDEVIGLDGGSFPQAAWQYHSGTKFGDEYVGPDFIFGYGQPQGAAAIAAVDRSNFVTGDIEQGLIDYPVFINSAALENGRLRVTLAWDDPPFSDTGGAPSEQSGFLQNNLDLVVIDPDGETYYPWVLDHSAPGEPAQQNDTTQFAFAPAALRDNRNTIEQVDIAVPLDLQNQTWTIRVWGTNMLLGPQEFTLVSQAIQPETDCGDIPNIVDLYPPVPPDNPLYFCLLIIAIIILALLIFALLLHMYNYYEQKSGWQTAIVNIILMLLFLLIVFYLLMRWAINPLAIFLMVLTIYAFINNQ